MKSKKLLFSTLSFLLSTTITSCNLFDPDDSKLISKNLLEVDLIKREYFQNEAIDLSGLKVRGFIERTASYTDDVDYTIRWESSGLLIRDGDLITLEEGKYYWIFTAPTYHSYRIAISVYAPKTDDPYVETYPIHQYFSSNNRFSYDGLVVKRKVTYSTENENGTLINQTRIYDIPLKDCTISYLNGKDEIPLSSSYSFPQGLKGIFTVSIYAPSFITAKRKKAGSYKINISDEQDSTSLSLSDFDESTITKFQTDDTITLTIENKNIEAERKNGTNNYIAPENVSNDFGLDYYTEVNDEGKVLCPSKGDVPLLVIPLYYNDQQTNNLLAEKNNDLSDNTLNLIDKCFFGNSNDLYFESLRSYYYKSSYGKLNFYGEVMPPFNPQTKVSNLKFVDGALTVGTKEFQNIIKSAIDFIKELGIDLRDYDSNADGYIDAVWFVSFSKLANSTVASAWPHTNNFLNTTPNISSPVVNMFSWAPIETLSNQFYFRKFGGLGTNHDGDAHTIIHETGHLLGLSDYYSTAPDESYTLETNGVVDTNPTKYAPLGGMDMMDQNYLDHNPYSKLLFNWTKPYLVYGNSTITLKPSLYKNQVVVIPYDTLNYSSSIYKNERNETIFNPYDEYLVLDFFTPASDYSMNDYTNDNLNTKAYDVYKTQPLTYTGVRIYHVDRRGVVAVDTHEKDEDGKKIIAYSLPDNPAEVLSLQPGEKLACPITNTEYGVNAEKGSNNRDGKISFFDNYCDEIRALTSNPLEYADSSYSILNNRYMKNASMLKANGTIFRPGSYFNIANYTAQSKVIKYPTTMKDYERREKLSCFGFAQSLLKDFTPEDFIEFYLFITAIQNGGYTAFGYTNSQYNILTKYFNYYKNGTALNVTESERNIFNSLLSPVGYSRATFNNSKPCSYTISIS